jgi:hypothetical protein
MKHQEFKIYPPKIISILSAIVIVLVVINILVWYIPRHFQLNMGILPGLFSLDSETNIPTYFQVILFELCSILLILIVLNVREHNLPGNFHWKMLAVGFFVMSCDEFMSLHEKITKPMANLMGTYRSVFFYFGWVPIGIFLVIILALVFIPFLRKLPRRTMWLFLLAGVIYIVGCIGMEMIGGSVIMTSGRGRSYFICFTIEETFEMFGTILFIYGLLDYIQNSVEKVRIKFLGRNEEMNP